MRLPQGFLVADTNGNITQVLELGLQPLPQPPYPPDSITKARETNLLTGWIVLSQWYDGHLERGFWMK